MSLLFGSICLGKSGRVGRGWLVPIVASLLLVAPGWGQSTDASLTGLVTDPTGATVAEAAVTMRNTRTGVATRTATNASGSYAFPSLQPGQYRLEVEKTGFGKIVLNGLNLEVGARLGQDVALALGTTNEVVEVVAGVDSPMAYATSSISGVITERKVLELPVSSRNALNLTTTMAGTNGANFNGARRGNLNVQMDGINVMDARINLGVNSTVTASVDRIAEFRIIAQPVDAEFGRGSGQVQMITRSGTNEFHGSLFNFHRNTVLNANNWFNNLNGVDREILIRNQYGGRVGGPVKKNRTFFHFLYEGEKVRSNETVNTTVWTEPLRRGTYRYFAGVQNGNANAARPTVSPDGTPLPPTAGAALLSANLFGVDANRPGLDSTGLVRRYIDAMPMPNNFRGGDGLNTAFYTWNRPGRFDSTQYNVKFDHIFTDKHRVAFSTSIERGDEFNGFMPQNWPTIRGGTTQQRDYLYSLTLTSVVSPSVLNEFRAGALRPRFRFFAPWELEPGILPTSGGTPFAVDFATITDPVRIDNDPQGRISPNYQIFNKTSVIRGAHNYKFGGQLWFVSSNGFNSFSVLPRGVVGAGGVPVQGVAALPGIGANQTGAQNMLNDLNGSLANLSQALNAPGGPNPSFLPGEPKQRTWRAPEFSLFFQDDWKATKSLTINLGLRYEWYGVPSDPNGKTAGLAGGSQGIFGISGTDWGGLFRPGSTGGALTQVELLGPGSSNPNRRLYNNDWNNWSPAVGMAYSLPWLGKDKTIFRAGYSIAYERISIRLLDVISGDQPGLRQVANFQSAQKLDLANARFPVASSAAALALVPLTDRTQTVRAYDSGLRIPMIHNFNAGITRSMPKGGTLTVNYVGSKGVRLLRGADVNEHNIFENGILDAFRVTAAGGNAPLFDQMLRGLTVPGRGVVDGVSLTGSQVLRDINTTTQGNFAQGAVGSLASFLSNNLYLTGQNGGLLRNGRLPENFVMANPQFASARLFGNLSSSSYHSMQVEYLQRAKDLTLQWNYTFAKGLGDEDGDAQEQNDSFRTQRNRGLDKRLLGLSAHHIMRSNAIYDLPFGPNRRWARADNWTRHLVGGWQVGGIFNVFSGTPLALEALGATTFNAWNDNTPVNHQAVDGHLGAVQRTGNGVVYFGNLVQTPDPIIGSLGTATLRNRSTLRAIRVGDANGPLLLSNPAPGQLGPMSQRSIYGPMSFRLDANLIKTIRITERVSFQLNAIFENATNSPQWGNPNRDINDLNFGRITTAEGERVVVVGGRINF
jgi:hypothetical protein